MISFQNFSFRYEESKDFTLRGIDMTVQTGEFILLTGRSGCGKTTLIRSLNGLIPHFYPGEIQGDLLMDGHSLLEMKPSELAGQVGTVFQDPRSQFFMTDTTRELAFGCENLGLPREETIDRIAKAAKCLDFALGNQLIKVNPCLIVEVPWTFKQSKEEIALTQEEQDNFLSEMEDSWYKEMFYFMCLTGVRVGELGGMKWSDIDFKKKVVHVRRSLSCSYYNGEKRMMLVTPKTVNSIREIPFLGEMEEILKAQRKKQNKLKEELGSRWRSTDDLKDLVFTTGMGSPCVRYVVEKEIKKALKRMREKEGVLAVQENREPREIRDFHPHSLRHTFATRCFEKKMEPKVVQRLMGHSSISITLNIYTHVLDNIMEEEIKKFGVVKTQTPEEYYNEEIRRARISAMSHC